MVVGDAADAIEAIDKEYPFPSYTAKAKAKMMNKFLFRLGIWRLISTTECQITHFFTKNGQFYQKKPFASRSASSSVILSLLSHLLDIL